MFTNINISIQTFDSSITFLHTYKGNQGNWQYSTEVTFHENIRPENEKIPQSVRPLFLS